MIGKVQRRLAGRVSGADEVDVEPVRGARFAARGAVVDALADEPIEAVDREAAPRDAGGENDRSRPDDIVAVEGDFARRRIDAGDRARDQDFRAEPPRLLQRAARKLVARDAARESRDSSRSARTSRPGRPAPRARRRSCAVLRTRRRPPPRGRPARRR